MQKKGQLSSAQRKKKEEEEEKKKRYTKIPISVNQTANDSIQI